jgi:outer membrane protein assembly factor BamD (BamD/ComL family)
VRLERVQAPQLPTQKKKKTFLPIGIAILVVVCIASGVLWYLNHQADIKRATERFEKFVAEVDKTIAPKQKLAMLEEYIKENPRSPNIGAVQDKMLEANELLEDQAFDKITLEISSLDINEDYEKKAIALYSEFLGKYPNSRYTDRINKAITDIKNLLDQYYYEELKRAARLDFAERTETYRNYLARFPKGRYREDVEILIEEMGRQYLEYIKTEVAQCDQNQRWKPCIERCDAFIEVYKDMELAKEASTLKAQIIDKRDLRDLTRKVQAAGNDFQTAYNLYQAYLSRHPQSSQSAEIKQRIKDLESRLVDQRRWNAVRGFASNPNNSLYERVQRLDTYLRNNVSGPFSSDAQDLMAHLEADRQVMLQQRQAQARQQEEQARLRREREKQEQQKVRAKQYQAEMEGQLSGSPRFRANGNGTVTDSNTGLIWALLDTHQELGGCVAYDSALAYVHGLRHGGYTDWRLPTASELAAIYKQPPYFPPSGAQWYWTSESYAKGFHTVTNIVTAKPETVFQREYRPVTECGWVRAVRP